MTPHTFASAQDAISSKVDVEEVSPPISEEQEDVVEVSPPTSKRPGKCRGG